MGLPLEQWRSGEADGKGEASGCRTPGNGQARTASAAAGGDRPCPAAPRKRRAAAAGVVAQQRRDYYTGDDVEAFFAAHNL
ncbi:uncharacterized protein LOC133911065 [Phragmites australis]|uniref:uncharacterized protein LOC133911065 n=1 Tax=Phragmites australis TaxID=29695 RepID=UPI002D792382|nr:uncharacterized protein LOC133911065 [Phragmites australis]